MLRSVISLILLLCLCTGPILQAQFTLRGSISGAVTDPSGALVPDSEVVLLDVDRNQRTEAKTTGAGLYTFANLPTGHYQVAVQRTGFGRSTSSVVELGANQQLRVDMSLQVGAVSDAVQVHAEAPMLDTEQTSVGQVVNQKNG